MRVSKLIRRRKRHLPKMALVIPGAEKIMHRRYVRHIQPLVGDGKIFMQLPI